MTVLFSRFQCYCENSENKTAAKITLGPAVYNRIGGVMVSVLTSSAVDRGFEPQSGQTKDY